jgi:hypothetical protein
VVFPAPLQPPRMQRTGLMGFLSAEKCFFARRNPSVGQLCAAYHLSADGGGV